MTLKIQFRRGYEGFLKRTGSPSGPVFYFCLGAIRPTRMSYLEKGKTIVGCQNVRRVEDTFIMSIALQQTRLIYLTPVGMISKITLGIVGLQSFIQHKRLIFSMKLFKAAIENRSAFFLTVFGVLILIFSLLYDISGAGKRGLGSAQLSIAMVGTTMVILGVGFMLSTGENDKPVTLHFLFIKIPALPNLLWVVIGFFAAYIFFLILPMFFNPIHRMVYISKYLPDNAPIGGDLIGTLGAIKDWFGQGHAEFYYAPLVTILFSPLLLVPYPTYYYIITVATVISFSLLAVILPSLSVRKTDRAAALFVIGISSLSYGLQFELERGQFHTIAMMFCISAVYLFHRHPRYRFFAYVLFCIAVQFKIYPALFIVMFVDDWRDWKTNIKRFASLGVANFLLLFLLGYSYFSQFLAHIVESSLVTKEVWNGNHSIDGFFHYLLLPTTHLLNTNARAWLEQHIDVMMSLLLVYFLICFLVVWWNAYQRNTHDVDASLLMACVLGGLLIPAINHDYTLPLLTAPFALLISQRYTSNISKRILVVLLIVISSFTYAITLVPFLRKPPLLLNNFPLLIILLTTTTLFSILGDKNPAIVLDINKHDAEI